MRFLLALALTAVLSACGPIDRASTRVPVVPSAGERVEATVTRVVDGDTIHVALDGGDVTIRFIGIDTPETVAPGQPIECYGPQASHFTTSELTGRQIALEFDRQVIDPFDRTLAYVWLGDELFNETLVQDGFAEAKSYPPNTRYQTELDAAEERARSTGIGMWGAC